MNTIDALIDTLATKPPQRRLAFAPRVALDAVLVTAYVAALVLFYTGARPDLAQMVAQPLYALEAASLYALLLSTMAATHQLGYPDLRQRRGWLYLPFGLFTLFAITVAFAWLADTPPTPPPADELTCLVEILQFSLLPAAYCLFRLRGMATTRPGLAGATAALAAFSAGALILRLSEDTNAIGHLVVWHYLPALGVAILGVLIGKIGLRW
jgi:hypothetical protein